MGTRAGVVAAALALALGGCYWTSPRADGALAVMTSIPLSVISNPSGYTMRAYLYRADGVSASYKDATGKATTTPGPGSTIHVTASGKPITLDGHSYWEVQLAVGAASGDFAIDGIPAGVRCRLALQLWNWTQSGRVDYEGLSNEFVASPGVPSIVAVDLYVPGL